jgi:hypothetical protein
MGYPVTDPAAPREIDEETSGMYEGDPEGLRKFRSKRPTDERIGRLETKSDTHTAAIADLKASIATSVGEIKGDIGELAGEVRGLATVVRDERARDDITFSESVHIRSAKALDQIDEGKGKRDEAADKRKALRWTIAKVIGGLLGGGIIVELIHWLASR